MFVSSFITPVINNKLSYKDGLIMEAVLRPNRAEMEFLTLAYNKFYSIFDEVISNSFWEENSYYRFSKIKDGFAIYTEVLNYEPIKMIIKEMKIKRPPMESEISSELFKFIRNILFHFPVFEYWDEVWINKNIVNWNKEGQSIDWFLNKYTGRDQIKYRFWEEERRLMTYINISFPQEYGEYTKIYLKDMLSEKDGVKFSFILMKQIMNTQVVEN